MNWKKAIGFGLLLWIIMFVVVSAFVAFNWYQFLWIQVVIAIIAGIIVWILADYVDIKNYSLALSYGLTWVIVGLILDALISYQFDNSIFTSWTLWLGYLLVLLVPLFRIKKSGV